MNELRQLSAEGLELIGEGTTAKVYGLSADEVVKVFSSFISPEEIRGYFTVTKKLEEAGINVAKAKELVKVGDTLGIIYERVSSRNVGDIIFHGIGGRDMAAFGKWTDYYVEKARSLHAITFPDGTFPDIRERYAKKLDAISGIILSSEYVPCLKEYLFSIPKFCHYLHGDLNPTNIIIGDKDRLIDAGEAALGDGIFDFAYLSSIVVFFEKLFPGFCEKHYQASAEDIRLFYDMVIDRYYAGCSGEERSGIREKLKILGVIYGVTTNMGSGDYIEQIRMAADRLVKSYL